MQTRLRQHVRELTTSFWFIPTFLTLASICAAIGALRVDMFFSMGQWAAENPVLFTSGEGARTLLATLAGSAISVAGVVFSITIVVLNMAAAQFGPRLLGNFMHHRGTQVVLGAFVATFTYSLIVLRFVDDSGGFVPHVAANIGFLLGLLSFFLLIYFIHHVSVFIQAARVIDDVATKMERALKNSFPERRPNEKQSPDEEDDDGSIRRLEESGKKVTTRRAGYLQVVDQQNLLTIATHKNLEILMNFRPGHFVIQDATVARVLPAENLDDEAAEAICECLGFGLERSMAQDPEFAVHQLVEIALRALSPGINDPFTALNCIDRLGAALALLASRQLPSRYLRDSTGRIRVITNPLTYSGIVDAAFNQVRQISHGNAAVTFRMLELIAELAHRDNPDAFLETLAGQLGAMKQENTGSFQNNYDREHYETRLREAQAAIARN